MSQTVNTGCPQPRPTAMSSSGSMCNKFRTLVVCFDGTSNEYDGNNTNVVTFFSLLKKDDCEQQLCYYQPGIGTYFNAGVVSPWFQWCAKILDEAFAWYLDAHVRGGYTFLMQNYRPGDKICIFGFSRGAYTARALAGFLHKIGLLNRDNPEQLTFAYKLYRRTDQEGLELASGYKKTFCTAVKVDFVGVWDTVASVGIVMGRNLPFTTSNTTIVTFRHALSLDEHRAKFRPNLYHRPANNAKNARKDPEHASPAVESWWKRMMHISGSQAVPLTPHADSDGSGKLNGKRNTLSRCFPKRTGHKKQMKLQVNKTDHVVVMEPAGPSTIENAVPDDSSEDDTDEIAGGTDVLEVWFAGCHSDIGGGAVPDNTEYSLAQPTLHWMIREVVQSQCGILFDEAALQRAGIPNSTFCGHGFAVESPLPQSPSMSPKSELSTNPAPQDGTGQNDLNAMQPLHDELKLNVLWWILEIVPTNYSYQDGNGTWHSTWCIHLGAGRDIPDIGPKFHVSVRDRMQNQALKYTPRATWKQGTEQFVE